MKTAAEGTVLDKIAKSTRARIEKAKRDIPLEKLESMPRRRPVLDFIKAVSGPEARVIAEVKPKSPSDPVPVDLDPVETGLDYARNGASAISVLTEPDFFGGSLDTLRALHERLSVPLLMKDFFLDPYQVRQALAYGADAALLMVSLLGREGLGEMLAETRKAGLAALVEAYTEEEMAIALDAKAPLIGVNNRNLKTLGVDLEVTRRLAAMATGSGAVLVAASGLRSRAELEERRALGYTGFLIGTTLMRSGRPGAALAELLGRKPAP